MAIFSKPVELHCSCYELGHCWTPHCSQACTDVARDVFTEAIKIYGALYLVSNSSKPYASEFQKCQVCPTFKTKQVGMLSIDLPFKLCYQLFILNLT